MSYIKEGKPTDGSCVFCTALAQEDGPGNLIVHRGPHAFVILNRYPYTSGHLMVLPYDHVRRLDEVSVDTRAEMMELTSLSTEVLRRVYQPEGFNLGANLGSAAGAGIEEHLHLHIVPRWVGDTNFMTATGGTRVIPQSLEETWTLIKDAWPK
jgi:ATP adenylyltransferase